MGQSASGDSGYPHAVWRLLYSAPADGATNMAVDEAILQAVAAGLVPPTLRFYAWEPPCLSLGRSQPARDVNLEALAADGVGLVRRPTGGRAILHIDELTYSVIAPEGEPRVAGSILESYRRLSAALVHGLAYLGIEGISADRRLERCSGPSGPVCFEVPSHYEITVNGRKLVGSAQMRAQGTVLQHGAVPLYGDLARICRYLVDHPDPERVRLRAISVSEALGRQVTWAEVARALEIGFAAKLNLHLEHGELTPQEQAWAEALRKSKYGDDPWTRRL